MSTKDWTRRTTTRSSVSPRTPPSRRSRRAYRKLARDNHPDQNPGNAAAEQRFKEISEANDVLSNQAKRKEYDEARRLFGSGGFRFPRSGGSQSSGPSVDDLFRNAGGGLGDIFGGLFNGGPTTQTTRLLHRPRATPG